MFNSNRNHFVILTMVLSLVLNTQGQENRKTQNMAELPKGVTPSKGVVIIVLSIIFISR
jgi:hypothetical protein